MNGNLSLRPLLLAAVVAVSCGPVSAESKAYDIRDGRVFFPGWDDRVATATRELASVPAKAFEKPANVYAERLILSLGSARTAPVRIPEGARVMAIVVRAMPEEAIFPRISVRLETGDAGEGREVYRGLVQSVGMATIRVPVPVDLAGRDCRIRVEVLNPSTPGYGRGIYLSRFFFE